MDFNKIKFDSKDIVKMLGIFGLIGSMWYDLKTSFAVEHATTNEVHKHLQYQIDELKQTAFIRPDAPAIKTYRIGK